MATRFEKALAALWPIATGCVLILAFLLGANVFRQSATDAVGLAVIVGTAWSLFTFYELERLIPEVCKSDSFDDIMQEISAGSVNAVCFLLIYVIYLLTSTMVWGATLSAVVGFIGSAMFSSFMSVAMIFRSSLLMIALVAGIDAGAYSGRSLVALAAFASVMALQFAWTAWEWRFWRPPAV